MTEEYTRGTKYTYKKLIENGVNWWKDKVWFRANGTTPLKIKSISFISPNSYRVHYYYLNDSSPYDYKVTGETTLVMSEESEREMNTTIKNVINCKPRNGWYGDYVCEVRIPTKESSYNLNCKETDLGFYKLTLTDETRKKK